MAESELRVAARPELARPVLIAAFRGWNDGAQAASLAGGYLAARRSAAPRLFRAALVVLALLLLQVGLGELQYHTHLPWGLVLVHVALAATVWVGVVALVTLFHRPPRGVVAERA